MVLSNIFDGRAAMHCLATKIASCQPQGASSAEKYAQIFLPCKSEAPLCLIGMLESQPCCTQQMMGTVIPVMQPKSLCKACNKKQRPATFLRSLPQALARMSCLGRSSNACGVDLGICCHSLRDLLRGHCLWAILACNSNEVGDHECATHGLNVLTKPLCVSLPLLGTSAWSVCRSTLHFQ